MNADAVTGHGVLSVKDRRHPVQSGPEASLQAKDNPTRDLGWMDSRELNDVAPYTSPVPPPVVRVAMLRAPGRVLRVVAADATNQLREARIMVVQLGTGGIALNDAEISSRARVGAYDLVLQIGPQVPAAVRLAAGLGVPLLELGIPWPPSVVNAVKHALADGATVQPLLEVELDGASVLTSGAVRVLHGSTHGRTHELDADEVFAPGVSIQPTSRGPLLELCSEGYEPRAAACVEINGEGPVRLVVEGMEHVGARAVVRRHPVGLRLVGPARRR